VHRSALNALLKRGEAVVIQTDIGGAPYEWAAP
jgi:hypothetical protein